MIEHTALMVYSGLDVSGLGAFMLSGGSKVSFLEGVIGVL